jgi:CheY-like chemotaxis protein
MYTTKKEILIVEDDKVISKIHYLRVKKISSVDCVFCFNGKEAIDYLDGLQESKRILILLDINMPVMNGWEFLENCKTRAYNSRIEVIIVSSSSYKEDRKKAAGYEIVKGFYNKPLEAIGINEILSFQDLL